MSRLFVFPPQLLIAAIVPWLAGCAASMLSDRDCMTRVMYFESNRSSPEGMLAVGTTVMNRLEAPGYPKTVCGVVGQPRQFRRRGARQADDATGSGAGRRGGRPGPGRGAPPAGRRRHVLPHGGARRFPYRNMHYVVVAGGNAFYEKRSGPDHGAPDPAVSADAALQVPQAVPEPPSEPSAEAVAEAADGAVADPD